MKALVVGGSGYTGGELIRLLLSHPNVDEVEATSRAYLGKPFSSAHPNLPVDAGVFTQFTSTNADADVVFLALPHTTSMTVVGDLWEQDVKIIDLSADYRFNDPKVFEKTYEIHQTPELLQHSVYGLPELFREKIKKARLAGNPGCYATAAILAIAPLVRLDVDVAHIVVDAKSGTSGAGVKPTLFLHASEVEGNLKPYKVTGHRHQAEIDYILGLSNPDVSVHFTPTLAPFSRGINETVHVFGGVEDLWATYESFYRSEPFVRVVGESYIKNVVYSNFCDIAVYTDQEKGRHVIVSSIDNLLKGASGQAVQNMNLMLGYDESMGLMALPPHP